MHRAAFGFAEVPVRAVVRIDRKIRFSAVGARSKIPRRPSGRVCEAARDVTNIWGATNNAANARASPSEPNATGIPMMPNGGNRGSPNVNGFSSFSSSEPAPKALLQHQYSMPDVVIGLLAGVAILNVDVVAFCGRLARILRRLKNRMALPRAATLVGSEIRSLVPQPQELEHILRDGIAGLGLPVPSLLTITLSNRS